MRPCLVFFVLFFIAVARADYSPPPFQQVVVSGDSEYVVRVDPGRRLEAEKRRLPDWVSIHRYDSVKRVFCQVTQFEYGEHPGSGFLFIANGGRFVIGVNVGAWIGHDKLGIRLYDRGGILMKVWRITDFLSQEEIDGCAKTGSTVQWFRSGAFSYNGQKFEFLGPATQIASWGSTYTVMQGVKEGPVFASALILRI